MTYEAFLNCTSLNKQDLLALGNSTLFENSPGTIPSLPAPPLLMFDRVMNIERGNSGRLTAEQDVPLDAWYFTCHFKNDPVLPGCLGVDAIWQLLGLFCALNGAKGTGRALGCKEVEFSGQVRPHNKVVKYEIEIRRFAVVRGTMLVIGDGSVSVDGDKIYHIEKAKVGVFPDSIRYADYPNPSPNSKGGLTRR